MAEYRSVTKPRAVWDSDLGCDIDVPRIVTIEEDDGENTGLVDVNGNPIHRFVKTRLGFI
jgi:hypothetical protein